MLACSPRAPASSERPLIRSRGGGQRKCGRKVGEARVDRGAAADLKSKEMRQVPQVLLMKRLDD